MAQEIKPGEKPKAEKPVIDKAAVADLDKGKQKAVLTNETVKK